MSIFVKQFDSALAGAFSKVLKTANGLNIAVGSVGNAAYMISLDPNGQVLAQWQYASAGMSIGFINIIEIKEGYLAFGYKKIQANRSHALVVRLDLQGTVVWAKTYGNDTTRIAVNITPSHSDLKAGAFPEQFILVNRNNLASTRDEIELIGINLEGLVTRSKMLGLSIDQNRPVQLAPFGKNSAAIYGGTNEQNGYKAFIVGFDFNLKVNYKKLIGGSSYQEITAIAPAGNQFIAAGVAQANTPPTNKKSATAANPYNNFLFKFDLNTISAVAKAYFLQLNINTIVSNTDPAPSHYVLGASDGGSTTAKFDDQFNLLWAKRLNIPNLQYINDALYSTPDKEIILCGLAQTGGHNSPLVCRTDQEYNTCVTLENPKPPPQAIKFQFTDFPSIQIPYEPVGMPLTLTIRADTIPHRFICPAPVHTIPPGGLVQSPYLQMQAAGSDRSDGSSPGIQLRWRFRKSLGDRHMAKGPYSNAGSPYHTAIGFNKPDDYVKIYRTPYRKPYQAQVRFLDNILPTQEIQAGNIRVWRYNNVALANGGTGTTNVHIRFNDLASYDAIRATMPVLQPETFIKQYPGILEVECIGKLVFSVRFSVGYNPGNTAQAYVRTEAVSFEDPADPASVFIAARKTFQGPAQLVNPTIIGENLKYIRLDQSIAYVSGIMLETYHDFIFNTVAQPVPNTWEYLDSFALTLDSALAFDRLENKDNPYIPNSKKYTVDRQWNKYNEADATGAFKVRVDNYKHRWYPAPTAEHPNSRAQDGLQQTIQDYLTLSKTDPRAMAAVPVEGDPGNKAKLDVSYFDILRLVGTDYHIARMMGLGHIDAQAGENESSYVYLMAYTSWGAREPGNPPGTVKDHLYMTLPTRRTDYRLPKAPVQWPVSYGIVTNNSLGEPNYFTDMNGYVPLDAVRFVNIQRQGMAYETPFGYFYDDPTEFSLAEETIPVMYGLEYREQSEAVFRKPEITQDDEYFDHAGFNEVVEIPEQGKNLLYIHQEREEGVHCYGIYAINWFSRSSPLSNLECTDYTQFQKSKTLLPPANFAVQLIQPEKPLMLTSEKEQTAFGQLVSADKTLVRATFDWNHNHHLNYPFAERAQLFFREAPAESFRGEVVSVTQLPNHQVLVKVREFEIWSTMPKQTVAPVIPAGQEGKYIGSLFSYGEQALVISSIDNTIGTYPDFTLDQIQQKDSIDPLNNNQFVTVVQWLKPQPGNRFLVVENLAVEANWSTHLQRTVYLEKFHTVDTIRLESTGTANNGTYRLEQAVKIGATTELLLLDKLKNNIVAGNIRYERVFRLHSLNPGTKKIGIKGNVASEFAPGISFRLFGSSYQNNQYYTVAGMSAYSPFQGITAITFSGTIPDATASFGYVAVEKTAVIVGVNRKARTVTVKEAIAPIIIPPYIETRVNPDNTETKLTCGGIYRSASVQELPNKFINPAPPYNLIQEHVGVYSVVFNSNYALPPHIDPGVEWYKGIVRILEVNLPTRKSLQVWEIKKDATGLPVTPLELVVFDPEFDQATKINLIQTGNDVMVNFHPSYRLYLNAEFNAVNAPDAAHQFNQATIMPASGDGSKMTYMGIRSTDRYKQSPANTIVQCESYIAPMVPLLAREVAEPRPPKGLTGPGFATRPDFYQKSSYTVDIHLDTDAGRTPFGVLVYRGTETKVLDTLYKEATIKGMLPIIDDLKKNNPAMYYTMLADLVNVRVDGAGNFQPTGNPNQFSFGLPDNPYYLIPDRDPKKKEYPFTTPTYMTDPTKIGIVQQAIWDSFLSMTEQPVIYKYVKGGVSTAGNKPVIRNYNGELITPVLPGSANPEGYDPHPMAAKFAKNTAGAILLPQDSNYHDPANKFYVRFTDFTLDGASLEWYFYYACEINNQLVIGPPSVVIAPVLLVNSAPAEAPGIREVVAIIADPARKAVTSVQFKLNNYNESEGITQFWIYRAYNAADASNIRTMKLAKKIDVGQPYIDDFTELPVPPYGETLFYKIVAVRRIKNELSLDEDILSLPSKAVQTSIVDVFNPKPPKLWAENGTSTPAALQNVILKWKPTAYNGTYYLQKLNAAGNWVELHRIKVKDTDMQYPPLDGSNLPDFTNFSATQTLLRKDGEGNNIYHRFRVQVENSSGLFNLSEFELTLAKGASDLQELDSFLNYADTNNHQLPVLVSSNIVSGASQPGQMIFTHLMAPLPAGHNTFDKVEVTVTDDLAHTFTRTITTPGGSAVFSHGDGGLVLDASNPNRTYKIRTRLYTDFSAEGAVQAFTLHYLAGPCFDLKVNTDIINITDGTHDFNPALVSSVNDGLPYPSLLKFAPGAGWTALGQTLSQIIVTVTDDIGNTATKNIDAAHPSVLFDGSDNLILDSSRPNSRYEVKLNIATLECPLSREAVYRIFYTHTPCDELTGLTNIAKLTDNNSPAGISLVANHAIQGFIHPNGQIIIHETISANLPVGHNFQNMEVVVEDDLGATFRQNIQQAGGAVTFRHGDGNLVLNGSNPKRTYFLILVLYTDLCSNGSQHKFTVKY